MLAKFWEEPAYRIDVCRVTRTACEVCKELTEILYQSVGICVIYYMDSLITVVLSLFLI